MKTTKSIMAIILLTSLGLATPVLAQNPAAGPPEEMKRIAYLEGEWDAQMEVSLGDSAETWVKSTGKCVYSYILDGAAMRFEYTSTFMEAPFTGIGVQCYDRETGQWQMSWIDNMGARLTLYNGVCGDGKSVFTGTDVWQGQEYLARLRTFDETETSFQWSMEMSTDGGKTWTVNGKATYTKKTK